MKYFKVTARQVADKERAKILENMINRPKLVERIFDKLEQILKDEMHEILWGKGIE
jgi:hypothetical protein